MSMVLPPETEAMDKLPLSKALYSARLISFDALARVLNVPVGESISGPSISAGDIELRSAGQPVVWEEAIGRKVLFLSVGSLDSNSASEVSASCTSQITPISSWLKFFAAI